MILITSSAYVGHELSAELGQLPACFLPVGNRRLISVQLFLSMLPLHADHPAHQHALLANGMRLFSLLESDTRATALPTRPARSGLGCSPR